jgi:integrase
VGTRKATPRIETDTNYGAVAPENRPDGLYEVRVSALAHLSIYGVDPERGIVTICQGKGKKDRVLPIADRVLAWLQKYILTVPPKTRPV